MRFLARRMAWVLPLVLTGCFIHRPQQAKNTPVAPPAPGDSKIPTVPVDLPPNATSIPPKPTETASTPTQPAPKPAPRRRSQPPKPSADVASNTPPPTPAVSAIGQLSSGNGADYRRETEDSIIAIEKGLNALKTPLSDADQKTADHIREFIKEARTALASGDVDGAHNLAAKAKVLLMELTK